MSNLYQKLAFFAIFETVGPHFKARPAKFGMGCGPGTPSPSQIL